MIAKMNISTQVSIDGMPILRSVSLIRFEGFTAPSETKKEMVIDCQKQKKMTSLMQSTFKKGRCGARSSLS